jgi:hypothetical protein
MINVKEFRKLVDTKSEALELILTFTNVKIRARSKQTPNGKYLVTFYV